MNNTILVILVILALKSITVFCSSRQRTDKTYRHPCLSKNEEGRKTLKGETVYKLPCQEHHQHRRHHRLRIEKEAKDPIIRFGRSIPLDAYPLEAQDQPMQNFTAEYSKENVSPKFQFIRKLLF